jgi:hypothetical protein
MPKLERIGYKLQEANMATDTERLNWLETKFFNPKIDKEEGITVWYLAADYRNILKDLEGDSLREAIDLEINGENSKTV